MFGRATIRLGIGPHSSLFLFCWLQYYVSCLGYFATFQCACVTFITNLFTYLLAVIPPAHYLTSWSHFVSSAKRGNVFARVFSLCVCKRDYSKLMDESSWTFWKRQLTGRRTMDHVLWWSVCTCRSCQLGIPGNAFTWFQNRPAFAAVWILRGPSIYNYSMLVTRAIAASRSHCTRLSRNNKHGGVLAACLCGFLSVYRSVGAGGY